MNANPGNKTLALFDFDGTITRSDTMFAFIRHTHGTMRLALGMLLLAPALIGVKLGLVGKAAGKQLLLRLFYRGWNAEKFARSGAEFCQQKLPALLRPAALEKIRWHISAGHQVFLVSASAEQWVGPWAEQEQLGFICTRLEINDGKITGRLQGKNCNGAEKVERVKNTLSLQRFTEIYAYGDTSGDRPMLALASHPHYRPFHHG